MGIETDSTGINMNANALVRYLDKPPGEFTKRDIIDYIENNDIDMVNFRYIGWDGRLKTLNFYPNGPSHLQRILTYGERVDGSNLLASIDPTSSDLYVVPRYDTAFVNPLSSIPAVDILCSYYSKDGSPLPGSPENVLRAAEHAFEERTGLEMRALGELEYYIIFERQPLYPGRPQRGYQEGGPFIKWESLRYEAMEAMVRAGCDIKYGHSEMGLLEEGGLGIEQHEIEFGHAGLLHAADQVVIAKWILRMIGYRYGVTVSFIPKIAEGLAGNGFHVHTKLRRDGKDAMTDGEELSTEAMKMVAGFLRLAPSLSAFGNIVPLSYLRLVPDQEAPTVVSWGPRNRSALLRVPLGWRGVPDMAMLENRGNDSDRIEALEPDQTVEFRVPDGSADTYLLLAGLAVAARQGFEMDDSLDLARKLYVKEDSIQSESARWKGKEMRLPTSCWESAAFLERDRHLYEAGTVFPPGIIDAAIARLRKYDDRGLNESLAGRKKKTRKYVDRFIQCA